MSHASSLLIGGLIVGAVALASKERSQVETVSAGKFVLVDATGKERGRWIADSGGKTDDHASRLQMMDSKGTVALELEIGDEGRAVVRIGTNDRRGSCTITRFASGGCSLIVLNNNDESEVDVGTNLVAERQEVGPGIITSGDTIVLKNGKRRALVSAHGTYYDKEE